MSNEHKSEDHPVNNVVQNISNSCANFFKNVVQSKAFKLTLICLILTIFIFRSEAQKYVLVAREYSFSIIMFLFVICISVLFAKKNVKKAWWFLPVILFFSTFNFVYWGGQQYVALYLKYEGLNKIELKELPLSNKVMPQPLNSVHVLAKQKVSETDEVGKPDRVLFGEKLNWTMEITPDYWFNKFGSIVEELYVVSGTSPSPNFSKREKVCFNVGEGLVMAANSYSAAIKSLNPLEYLSYFPVNVRYMNNDEGKIVQVISLAKWDGIFFPTIASGGVIVVEQNCDETFVQKLSRIVIGVGTHIEPEKFKNHKFLKGQNLLPYNVYRHWGSSFRYQKGFFGPLKANHEGDIRIPDMPNDQNEQPFVQYFDEMGENNESGMFATFALEPYKKESQGLAISLFIPGDSVNTVYYYHHADRQEGYTGSTAIVSKVQDKKKDYKWGDTVRPIESKLYIRDIAGKRRVLYQTVVAVVDEIGNMAGSEPEIAITDAQYNTVTFVDVTKNIEYWDKQIAENNANMYSQED